MSIFKQAKKAINTLAKSKHYDSEECTAKDDSFDHDKGITFTIYPADGGNIIKIYQFDYNKHKSEQKLYVIQDGANLAENIAEILTVFKLSN